MGFHTYPVERADALEDHSRYEYLSVDELLALLDPDPTDRVLDVGSGTGFYTDDVAAQVDGVVALDIQHDMHLEYREKGLPGNVHPATANAATLPFRDGVFDAAVSTMTYHEFASPDASAELARVLTGGGRLGIADWTRAGSGTEGPPLEERHDAATTADHLEDAGFRVDRAEDRRETFVLSAVAPESRDGQKSGRSSGGS